MSEEFVFSFKIADCPAPVTILATMQKIAETIGCRDYNECSCFKIYRMVDGEPRPCRWTDLPKQNCVYLTDWFGNFIATADYQEH